MTGGSTIVEQNSGARRCNSPQLKIGCAASLCPHDPEWIQAVGIHQNSGCGGANGDIDEPGGGRVARVRTDRETGVVIADQAERVNALLQIQIAPDLHGNVVVAPGGSWDSWDQRIRMPFGGIEEPCVPAGLVHVDQVEVECSVGVGWARREVGHIGSEPYGESILSPLV